MRDEQWGDARVLVRRLEPLAQFAAHPRVEHPGEGHTLALPAGQLTRERLPSSSN